MLMITPTSVGDMHYSKYYHNDKRCANLLPSKLPWNAPISFQGKRASLIPGNAIIYFQEWANLISEKNVIWRLRIFPVIEQSWCLVFLPFSSSMDLHFQIRIILKPQYIQSLFTKRVHMQMKNKWQRTKLWDNLKAFKWNNVMQQVIISLIYRCRCCILCNSLQFETNTQFSDT